MLTDQVLCLGIIFLWSAATQVLSQRNVTYCLGSNEPLLLPELVSHAELDQQKFVSFTWHFYAVNDSGVEQKGLKLLTESFDGDLTLHSDRWQRYEHWGLKMESPQFEDSGRYESVLTQTDVTRRESTTVVVAEPPILKSDQLNVSRQVDEATGNVILSCGTLSTLGNPPVELFWQAANGSALAGTYKNGNLTLTLSKEEGGGTFRCELKEPSPAVECILAADLPRWEGKFVFASTASSSEFSIILGVVIACVIVVLFIIIVVLIVLIRRKMKAKGRGYNTKQEEAKIDNGPGPDSAYPLMPQDDANPYDRPNTTASNKPYNHWTMEATSPSGQVASPYMVTGIRFSQGPTADSPPPKRNRAPVVAMESTDGVGGAGGNGRAGGTGKRYIKRGESKDNGIGGGEDNDGRQPPTPKKRSIFLAESNESLNRAVDKAMAGGTGSGTDRRKVSESKV